MHERRTTLALALGALLLFASLFMNREAVERPVEAPPTTLERGGDGLAGAAAWLQGEGIHTVSVRERFDALALRRDVPSRGNLLIVTTPMVTGLRGSEVQALDRWLRVGNTLLVLAALSDRPAWATVGFVNGDLRLLTGLDFVLRKRQPGDRWPSAWLGRTPRGQDPGARSAALAGWLKLAEPVRSTLVANRPHPYLDGVTAAVALSDYLPQVWDVTVPRAGFVLSLARQREMGAGVLWIRAVGSGTIIVSAFGSLFSNRALGLADNARLLANIVHSSVTATGAVLFDDEHQGLGIAYDPAKFYRDPRLYVTLGVLGAMWLLWVLGGTRLRVPRLRASAPREVELVRATGGFLARVLRTPVAARRMFDHFFRRLRLPSHPDAATMGPPWEWLEHHPRLLRADVRQLREWYADAYSDRRVPLARLQNLMVRTERQLTA